MDTFVIIVIAVIAIGSIMLVAAQSGAQAPSKFDTPKNDEYWKKEAERLEAQWAGQPRVPVNTPQRSTLGRVKARHEFLKTFICEVVGESFVNDNGERRQDVIDLYASRGIPVTLQPEPGNQYDPYAVAVLINTKQIGYLNRDVAGRMQPLLLDARHHCEAIVEDVHGGTPEKPSLGVTLNVTIYKLT